MRKMLSLLLMLLVSLSIATARVPKKRPSVTQVFTTDIVCENCEKKILSNVAVLGKGVQNVQVDVATKEVTVVYDNTKTDADKLVKGFAKLNVKATPKAEAPCCKKQEAKAEGGCCKKQETKAENGCCKKQEGKTEAACCKGKKKTAE